MFKDYKALEMWLEHGHQEIKFERRIHPVDVLANAEVFTCDFTIAGLSFTCDVEYFGVCSWLKRDHDYQCYGLTKDEIRDFINELPFPGREYLQEFTGNIKPMEI